MTYVDSILEEVEQMTPKTGFNVCIFDDFGDVGEKLTMIGHFETKKEADDLVAEYDEDVTLYIYGSEKAEEGQLDLSQQKGHNIDRYIDKAEREYEKGEQPDNDEFEKLNSQSKKEGESFVEQEHPRGQPENKGQFVKKNDKSDTKIDDTAIKEEGKSITKRMNKHGYGQNGVANLFNEAGIDVERNDYLYIGQPIRNNEELDAFNKSVEMFHEQVKKEPKLAKAYNSFKKQVKAYNGKLEKKYQKAETFKRGTSLDELESYLKDDCVSCDYYDLNKNSRERSYEFLSMSMNDSEVESLYNFGVIVDFDAESIRKIGKRVNYTAEPTPYPAQNSRLDSKVKGLETYDRDYDAYMADEQEVRIPTDTKLSDVKISKIRITGHKIMGHNHLSQFDKQLADDYVQSARDDIPQKEFYEKNEDRIIQAIKNKYGKLTDNIEVNYT